MDIFLEKHSGEVTIVILFILVAITLLILVPQLLRMRQHARELEHAEHMKALEKGLAVPNRDEQSNAAGRTASLVPMVVVCAAATVTCFLAAYKTDSFFSVSLAVWSVAGVVSLAAITGGVALVGRLAQLQMGEDDEETATEGPAQQP
jgi:fructose-1,6-bisphosphatase/inositol monophosphatase family enzyme